jgi:hypothetical protein
MINVNDWAEIRRLYFAERLGIRTIARQLGVARNTVRTAVRGSDPPDYKREPRGSLVDAVENQVCELLRDCPTVGPLWGTGPRPFRRMTLQIELAETRIPSFRSSPWMRTHPQRRFSRPSRTMRSTSSSLIGGRPGPRCFCHLRRLCLAASRCHRSSVSGGTKDRHRVRGSNRLSAARIARATGR